MQLKSLKKRTSEFLEILYILDQVKQYFYSNLRKDLWNDAEQSWKANIPCIRNKLADSEA